MAETQILVFCPPGQTRVEYVCSVLIECILGWKVRFTQEQEAYLSAQQPKMAYGLTSRGAGLEWPGQALLFQDGIDAGLCPSVRWEKNLPVLFDEQQGDWDLLASAFYFLSRYEEYQEFKADHLGRFPAKEALAFKNGFLDLPVVHHWALALADRLRKVNPALKPDLPAFTFLPTYDVDLAWAFLGRPFWRQAGSTLRDLVKWRLPRLEARTKTLLGLQLDPYFTFPDLFELHDRSNTPGHFFFLLADRGALDRNVPHAYAPLTALVHQIQSQFEVGIHPSTASAKDPARIWVEKERLEGIIQEPVISSRQHYLLLRFPQTYRNLLEVGIQSDYSMGFADAPGFRAGMAVPFPWFDLQANKATELMIHPFQVMDVSLRQYQGLPPEQALDTCRKIAASCRQVGGTFTTLWHNSSFAAMDGWQDWMGMYRELFYLN